MSKLLKLICMATVMTLIAGCGNKQDEPEPDPIAVEEAWLMTYDDYHSCLDSDPKYQNLSREVTFKWEGDELSIKGIFVDYSDVWIKASLRRNKGNIVSINSTQVMETDTDEPVYFHWGQIKDRSGAGHTYWSTGIAFFPMKGKPAFTISEDGNMMTLYKDLYDPIDGKTVSFWYTKNPDEIITYDWGYYKDNEFSETGEYRGTGFPDADIIVNMSFRKISDTNNII